MSDSMFPACCQARRVSLEPEAARCLLRDWEPEVAVVANPSHAATFAALAERWGIVLAAPPTAPRCELRSGDLLLVLQVAGLPRLDATRHEYTREEIAGAQWRFGLWEIE